MANSDMDKAVISLLKKGLGTLHQQRPHVDYDGSGMDGKGGAESGREHRTGSSIRIKSWWSSSRDTADLLSTQLR